MDITKCDRCCKEIGPTGIDCDDREVFTARIDPDNHFDLCGTCVKELREWLKGSTTMGHTDDEAAIAGRKQIWLDAIRRWQEFVGREEVTDTSQALCFLVAELGVKLDAIQSVLVEIRDGVPERKDDDEQI